MNFCVSLHFKQIKILKMKKALLLALLISCIGAMQAQTLSFLYNGETVADGDTLSLQATARDEFEFAPAIRNNGTESRTCIIRCEKKNNTSTEIMSVCTGLLCKTGYTSAPFALQGETTYSEAHIDFLVPADAEMGLFKITVYDTLNTSESTSMFVKMYHNDHVGIAENSNNIALSVYPNPAVSNVCISYSHVDRGSLVLFSMTGKKVREISLNASEGSVSLDISALPSGIYMYGIENGNGLSGLKKLVVK